MVEIRKAKIWERQHQELPKENKSKSAMEEDGFLYDNHSYSDGHPHWTLDHDKLHLSIPYTLSENYMQVDIPNGLTLGRKSSCLKDCRELLAEGGSRVSPKIMSVGLHSSLIGKPGGTAGLEEFLDHAKSFRFFDRAKRF